MALSAQELQRVQMGERLRAVREAKLYSVADVCLLAQISDESLRRFESGERSPKMDMAIRLAAVYGVTLDELVPEGAIEAHVPPAAVLDFLGRRGALPGAVSRSAQGARQSSRRSSVASSDTNAVAGTVSPEAVKEQQRRRSSKVSREGGISVMGLLPASMHQRAQRISPFGRAA